MNKQLEYFFDQTKQLQVLLCLALLLIIVIMVTPFDLGYGKPIGHLTIVVLLSYILFKNFTETHNLSLNKKDKTMSKNTRADLRNNMMASYILCFFIFILIIYILYSIFF